ncbi:MAG TPA: hypothetical protein PLN33_05465 [Hyphomonadaceae bacterium]|nr:hypothetical protein [Hyphomonadaceae bacterium]HPN04914.1 hypothetical protein [Hyphomonadaceae bacterium]
MLRKLVAAAAITTALGLAACSSGPTPYQPGAGNQAGYSESRLENDRFRVSFKGNSLTNRETVENYLLFRAAELTMQNGYDIFTIVKRDTDKDSRIRSSGGPGPFMGSRWSYTYFVPRYGWVRAWDPYPYWWGPQSYEEVTRYEAFAEVVMSRGPKGSDPNSFDARQVSQNLAGNIQRPTP